jgi:hypothetical protein
MAENNSHIKFCVAYTIRKEVKDEVIAILSNDGVQTHLRKTKEFEDNFDNFEDEDAALCFYESLLIRSDIYTANFCEIIKTTE